MQATLSLVPSAGRLYELRHTVWLIGHSQPREGVIINRIAVPVNAQLQRLLQLKNAPARTRAVEKLDYQ